jgi:peptide/nickel transport system substrate-binding protein
MGRHEIIDEYQVRFTFPEPDGLALVKFQVFALFAPAFFAEHKFEEMSWGFLSEPGPWGAGPFKLVEGGGQYRRPKERAVLEAFEDFWHPSPQYYPKVQRVIFDNSLIGNREEAMRLCREVEGAVDIVSYIRPLDTLKVAESPFAKVVKSKDFTLFGGNFNQRKRESKWRDIRLRKAVNYAINREELWKYAAKGNAWYLGGYIPPGAHGHNPDLVLWTYDTPKARTLLAEAGYPNGFEVNMIATESWKLEAQIISKMLERIGLKVRLDVLTHPQLAVKLYIPLLDKPPEEQEWDIIIADLHDYYGHAVSFLNVPFVEESEWRWIEYDPTYEKMWKEMSMTVDPVAQEEKLRQMVKYISDQVDGIFGYCPLTLYAVNKEVNFVPHKSQYLHLNMTSVTDEHWSIRGDTE